MELILKRIAKRKSYTIGKLFIVVDKLTSEQVDKLTSEQVDKLTSEQVLEGSSEQTQADKLDEDGNNSSTRQLVN